MHQHHSPTTNAMAVSATLHCLTGCAIGEVSGLIIGTALGLSTLITIVLSIFLAFVFGFGLSTLPLLKSGLTLGVALPIVFAADTLSITTMEITDNVVMAIVPGAMTGTLVNPIFWIAMPISLAAAYFVALPVNKFLIGKNKGHMLTMKYMDHAS